MTFGLIIAAGNQSRFKSDTPKALMKIGDKTLLDMNIEVMSKFCDDVYVVVSIQNQIKFFNYKRIAIRSGYGCGDAVYKAINNIPYHAGDKVYVAWGDAYNTELVYKSIPKDSKCAIPCVIEDFPYVQLTDDNRVLFSKYGETVSRGYHDLSLFYFDIQYMNDYLVEFKKKIWYNNKYNHKHGNEMQFLDVFNETAAKFDIINIKNYRAHCFNTYEEFNKMKDGIINED